MSESCLYPKDDPIYAHYHDFEWGMPVSDDRAIFEKVCLEGFQSGLSWKTILHRRENFREAFEQFEIDRLSCYTERDVMRLLHDTGIVRNRRKIQSAINNARRAKELIKEYGSLGSYFWQHEPNDAQRPKKVTRDWIKANPHTSESVALSSDLKKRGWTFVGPTNMYALMQALGLVNDHVHDCPAKKPVDIERDTFQRP